MKTESFDVISIPAFRDNYIWLLRHGRLAAVVDPGDAGPVQAVLAREGLQLAAILITHHHADHQGGVAKLLEDHSVEVFGPGAESITGLTTPLYGGERIRPFGAFGAAAEAGEFQVLAVPGHTLGHLAYVCGNRLFCGDTLFGAGCGRLFEGSPEQMSASLQSLAILPETTEVYCAHEYTEMNLRFAAAVEPDNPAIQQRIREAAALRARGEPTVPSTLVLEKATNPFLRCREPAAIAAAKRHGCAGEDPVSVFAALRAWRNEF
ncbi:MAG: hydroxyacylglutathione hydrolase [Pseudomonadota bacterium]|nr:hydroxyacylglutathione hydrolase [Pseudomonadota bacterium]